jgi:AraC-like DNA-binding protein
MLWRGGGLLRTGGNGDRVLDGDDSSGVESSVGGVRGLRLAPVEVSVVDDVDRYSAAVKGITPLSVQTGQGMGPSIVQTVQIGDIIATNSAIGFPMLSRTVVGDGDVAVVCITSTPEGGRWSEIDLVPGSVLAYGPGSEHAGIDPTGLAFTFVIAKSDELESLADELELGLAAPERGQIHALVRSPETRRLGDELSGLFDGAAGGLADANRRQDDILHAVVLALAVEDREQRVGSGSKIDSRRLTRTCIEYAETIRRAPTGRELCQVAHVSGRRLRAAFADVYGVPPSRFFQFWALGAAHQRLMEADPRSAFVADIAHEHGFAHSGRFAGMYKRLYGESPSTTLRISGGR